MARGFTTFPVVLKIGYDILAGRRAPTGTGLERFGEERRQAYERFFELLSWQLAAVDQVGTGVGLPGPARSVRIPVRLSRTKNGAAD